MMPITPSGTRIRPTWMPLGRNLRSLISPTGSGSAATCSTPSAIAATPLAESVRRSSSAGSRPAAMRGGQILLIGGDQRVALPADGRGDGAQGAVLGIAVGTRHEARRLARLLADGLHVLLDVHETCSGKTRARKLADYRNFHRPVALCRVNGTIVAAARTMNASVTSAKSQLPFAIKLRL
jgi:hypothetical protein